MGIQTHWICWCGVITAQFMHTSFEWGSDITRRMILCRRFSSSWSEVCRAMRLRGPLSHGCIVSAYGDLSGGRTSHRTYPYHDSAGKNRCNDPADHGDKRILAACLFQCSPCAYVRKKCCIIMDGQILKWIRDFQPIYAGIQRLQIGKCIQSGVTELLIIWFEITTGYSAATAQGTLLWITVYMPGQRGGAIGRDTENLFKMVQTFPIENLHVFCVRFW